MGGFLGAQACCIAVVGTTVLTRPVSRSYAWPKPLIQGDSWGADRNRSTSTCTFFSGSSTGTVAGSSSSLPVLLAYPSARTWNSAGASGDHRAGATARHDVRRDLQQRGCGCYQERGRPAGLPAQGRKPCVLVVPERHCRCGQGQACRIDADSGGRRRSGCLLKAGRRRGCARASAGSASGRCRFVRRELT